MKSIKISNNIFCLLSLISYISMIFYSHIENENVALNIIFISLALIIGILSNFIFKLKGNKLYAYFNKMINLIIYLLTFVSLMMLIVGRVSYFAFFVSGDIMGTGLSLFLITGIISLIISSILSGVIYFLGDTK